MHPADQVCMIMKRIYDVDMTSLTGGNISMMDDEGVMWVTPTSIDKKSLTRDDIVKVLPDGTIVGKHKPTSEYYIHRSILTKRRDIKAVIHAHAPATVSISVLNNAPDTTLYQDAYRVAGLAGLTPYALPGSMELVDRVMEAFDGGYDAAMLEKHSAFVGSKVDLLDAFQRFEALDYAARIQINCHTVGKPRPLSMDQLKLKVMEDMKAMPEIEIKVHTEKELEARRTLQAVVQRAFTKKLFTSAIGVMSARIDKNSFLISAQGVDNGYIGLNEFVLVKKGTREEGKIPNSTVQIHQKIYGKHPEVDSIIIASPVYTMGFLVTDAIYETTLYPESYGVLRKGKRYKYNAIFDDTENITNDMDLEHPVAMIENYGIILVGPNPILTFDKLEVCESSAQSIHECKRMGLEPIMMTKEQIHEMDHAS